MIFTGIGSRKTPKNVLEIIEELSFILATRKWTLRSGGADGADTAFESAFIEYGGNKQIFLPWKHFNDNPSQLYHVCKEAYEIAERIHSSWEKCSFGAKKLHARNVYQILGKDLNCPSDVVICWTENGEKIGGTRTALILAEEYMIPIINLGNCKYNEHYFSCKDKLIEYILDELQEK